MDVTEFRRLFAAFSGPERYREFLRALNREGRWRGRFLFWQEELLERFATCAPVGHVTFERVESLLRVCELHDADLVQDAEGLSQRCRGAVTDYTRAQAERFPNTDCGPVIMGRRFDNFRTGCGIARSVVLLRWSGELSMKIASVAEIKSRFSAFLKSSEGVPVVVTRNGRPLPTAMAPCESIKRDTR